MCIYLYTSSHQAAPSPELNQREVQMWADVPELNPEIDRAQAPSCWSGVLLADTGLPLNRAGEQIDARPLP